MVDLKAPFGEDINLGSQPDVAALGVRSNDFDFLIEREELIQRVIRRLLTPKGEWIPFPDYGGSLRLYVNEALSQQMALQVKSDVSAQLLLEPDIARAPAPMVTISQSPNGETLLNIKFYTVALQLISFAFNPKNGL